jgi:hypothetical protein
MLTRISSFIDIRIVDLCYYRGTWADLLRELIARAMIWWWRRALDACNPHEDAGGLHLDGFCICAFHLNEWLCVAETHIDRERRSR